MRKFILGNIKIEMSHVGEGHNGDYNPANPEDQKLLRFSVLTREGKSWEQVENSSYCTALSIDTPPKTQEAFLEDLMGKISGAMKEGKSIKRICEEATWFDPSKASR